MAAAADFTPNPPELDGVEDMSSLLYLEEQNVLHNLKIRFEKQTIYTAVGACAIDTQLSCAVHGVHCRWYGHNNRKATTYTLPGNDN